MGIKDQPINDILIEMEDRIAKLEEEVFKLKTRIMETTNEK